MKKKSIFQILILSTIVLISSVTYNKYFKDEEAKTLNEVVQDKIKNDDGGW